jgi:hypothetical protein
VSETERERERKRKRERERPLIIKRNSMSCTEKFNAIRKLRGDRQREQELNSLETSCDRVRG